ncbi:MAG: hypothetical protein NC517_11860 [Firmicutes bacterium]|nr:hypothetical protein [Bacillota bacterium]
MKRKKSGKTIRCVLQLAAFFALWGTASRAVLQGFSLCPPGAFSCGIRRRDVETLRVRVRLTAGSWRYLRIWVRIHFGVRSNCGVRSKSDERIILP